MKLEKENKTVESKKITVPQTEIKPQANSNKSYIYLGPTINSKNLTTFRVYNTLKDVPVFEKFFEDTEIITHLNALLISTEQLPKARKEMRSKTSRIKEHYNSLIKKLDELDVVYFEEMIIGE